MNSKTSLMKSTVVIHTFCDKKYILFSFLFDLNFLEKLYAITTYKPAVES